jgi:dihydrodipicolinate synthase/N-acetylneuraminate lyase
LRTLILPKLICSAPKAHVAIQNAFLAGDYKKAKDLQDTLADGDLAMQKLGVAGLKLIVKTYYGYGNGLARSPLPNANAEALQGQKGPLDKLMDLEFSL